MAIETLSDISGKYDKNPMVLGLFNNLGVGNSMILLNSLIYQMFTQCLRLFNIGYEDMGNDWSSFLKQDFNKPIEYKKLVRTLQAILRAEMGKVIRIGKEQVAMLQKRIKKLISRLPQYKEDAVLYMNLWLMKKLFSSSCIASLT